MTKKQEAECIEIALETLGLTWGEGDEPKSIKELKSELSEYKELAEKCRLYIEECNENIESANHHMNNIRAVIKQVEVEEYKKLNPNAKDVFYIQ